MTSMPRRWLIGMIEADLFDEALPERSSLNPTRWWSRASLLWLFGYFVESHSCALVVNDEPEAHHLGPYGDAWNHESAATLILPELELHQRKAGTLATQMLRDSLQVPADPIARDQQMEVAGLQVSRHSVNECCLIQLGVVRANGIEERDRACLTWRQELRLEIRICPAGHQRRVLEQLRDHLAPRSGIPPQFALDQDGPAMASDAKQVEAHVPREPELATEGNHLARARLDTVERDQLGVPEEQRL
jgi:hypothetical protein